MALLDWVLGLLLGLCVFLGVSLAMREPPQVFHRPPPDTDPPLPRKSGRGQGEDGNGPQA